MFRNRSIGHFYSLGYSVRILATLPATITEVLSILPQFSPRIP
jgi:hypothetical protein